MNRMDIQLSKPLVPLCAISAPRKAAPLRNAERTDFPALFLLICEMHTEQGIFSLDKEKLAAAIASAIDRGHVMVLEVGGRIIASVAYDEVTVWYSSEKFFADLWFYVTPSHRNSRCAITLKNELVRRTRPQKLMIGVVGRTLTAAKLFGHGLTPCGHLFIKEGK